MLAFYCSFHSFGPLLTLDLILRGVVEYRSLLQGIGEYHGEQALEGKLHGKARAQQDHRSCRGVLGVSCKVKLVRCACRIWLNKTLYHLTRPVLISQAKKLTR